jgi:hypothetical protein
MPKTIDQWIEEFWKMLSNNQLKEVDKMDLRKGVTDMEAIVNLDGDFDKYSIEDFLRKFASEIVMELVPKEAKTQLNNQFDYEEVSGYNRCRRQIIQNAKNLGIEI